MTCGKLPYESKSRAKAAAKRATSTHGGRAMEAYRCGACLVWHVGHGRRDAVVPCRTCGRPVSFAEQSGHSGPLTTIDAATGRIHDPRTCKAGA